jgi:two-component system, chemotaxis family, response regulator Rcp1
MFAENYGTSIATKDMKDWILVVEDNLGDAVLLNEAFLETKISPELVVATNCLDALSLLDKPRQGYWKLPRFVLLDLNLPKKRGADFIAQFKSFSPWRCVPILVLTSSQAETDIVECYGNHANAYLRKPDDIHGYRRLASSIHSFWIEHNVYVDSRH